MKRINTQRPAARRGVPERIRNDPVSYEVIVADRIENTTLDGVRFPSREDAEQALAIVRDVFTIGDDEAEIMPRKEPPTTTFNAWNEAGF